MAILRKESTFDRCPNCARMEEERDQALLEVSRLQAALEGTSERVERLVGER